MSARRAADVVRALSGLVSAEDAVRVLGDPVLRRTLQAAWAQEGPAIELLARAMRKSAQGNSGPLRLLNELHLGAAGPGSTRSRRVMAALHRWALKHGSLTWFVESSPLVHPRLRVVGAGETDRGGIDGLAARWQAERGVLEVATPAALGGHQAVLLKVDALDGIDLLGPGLLVGNGSDATVPFGDNGSVAPRWVELLTRPGSGGGPAA